MQMLIFFPLEMFFCLHTVMHQAITNNFRFHVVFSAQINLNCSYLHFTFVMMTTIAIQLHLVPNALNRV